MTAAHAVLLAFAGLAAGAINSVAGGGSLVSFPALLAAGYPTLTANATNLIAVTPGYVGGTVGYRKELGGQGARIRLLGSIVVAGAFTGTGILLIAPASAFDAVAPFCVLLACGLLVAQPRLVRRHEDARGDRSPALLAATFAGGVYGGYFGAGLGIMLLALLAVFVDEDIQRLNAVKGVLSLVVSLAAAAVLGIFGPVDWAACGVIAATSLVGGRLGVVVARRLEPQVLRLSVAAYGTVVAIVLLVT
jgi:uncharacterized membrane protein YfcA